MELIVLLLIIAVICLAVGGTAGFVICLGLLIGCLLIWANKTGRIR